MHVPVSVFAVGNVAPSFLKVLHADIVEQDIAHVSVALMMLFSHVFLSITKYLKVHAQCN